MSKLMKPTLLAAAAGLAFAAPAFAADELTPPEYVTQAKDLFKKSISFDTVEGRGKVPAFAAHLAGFLKEAGYADEDITITPMGETATLVATLAGESDANPTVLSAHMDVVEAKPEDWERDPFTATEENGYIYGRGTSDNKFGLTMLVVTMARLKEEGFKPKHDIVLALSGDEETHMDTTAALAEKFANAGLVLNSDGGGGALGEDGAPLGYALQGAEKTYADYLITITNEGGHSSAPRAKNAIYELAQAIDKIAAYQFPVQTSEITLGSLRAWSKVEDGELGAAMKKFVDNPKDKKAIATLRAEPSIVGQLSTTCVATMVDAGHAENALPQRAAANINCRIFPGVDPKEVRQTLINVIDNEEASVEFVEEVNYADASPMRDDVTGAVRKAVDSRFPDLEITPQMSAGASDSLHFRAKGVDSYGVGGLFMKVSDEFAHGLNERVPADAFDGALEHWHVLLTELEG